MKIQNSQLQLLKDLIEITTEKVALKLLYEELKNLLEERDIAHTILEITKNCPLCKGKKLINKKYCPSCMEDQKRFKQNRIYRYILILNSVPDIMQKIKITSK